MEELERDPGSPSEPTSPASVPQAGGDLAGPPPPPSWKCPHCGQGNAGESIACIGCGVTRG